MIAFFPELYPDELIYSVIARYHQRSGYELLVSTIDDIYRHRTVRPSFEFLNAFTQDAVSWLTKTKSFEDLVLYHSMYPFYAWFLPLDRKQTAFEALCRQEGCWDNLLSIRKTGDRFFRYCPKCAYEDRKRYGETYWHRSHQIQRLKVCPLHGCYLVDTDIRVAKAQSPSLYDAEGVIPKDYATEDCSSIEFDLAKYVYAVLSSPIRFINSDVGGYLHYKLNNKYVRGVSRDITALYADFQKFYNGMDIPPLPQLQKVFNGKLYDAFYICQIAFWESISVEEFSSITEEYIDSDTEQFYRELSCKYGIEMGTITQIGADIRRYMYESNRLHAKPGRRAYDYAKMDAELLPKVKSTIKQLLVSPDGRPLRLSVSKVEKALSLPPKRMDKLPKCKAYIQKYIEPQQEYWAREVVWAVKTIQEQQESMTWKHIRTLTNMRPSDLCVCYDHIKDKNVRIIVNEMLNR